MAEESCPTDFSYVMYESHDQVRGSMTMCNSEDPQSFSSYGQSENADSTYLNVRDLQRRFCNMLTTQKFCEWLKHEWLYSCTDREIFLGSNDFQLILREHFPTLKSRTLTRGQWSTIRRIIGRPRRFSATFLAEERRSVQEKRRNIQYLQHLVLTSSLGPMASEHLDTLLNCLPSTTNVPLRLPVGTKVCISLCTPVKGLYIGAVHDSRPGDGNYAVWIEDLILSNGLTTHPDASPEFKADLCGFRIVPDEDIYPLPDQSIPPPISISEIRRHFKENIKSNIAAYSTEYIASNSYPNTRFGDTFSNRPDYGEQSLSSIAGPLLSDSVCTSDGHLEVTGGADMAVDSLLITQVKPDTSNIPTYSEKPVSHPDYEQHTNRKLFASIAKLYEILENKRSSVETLRQLNDTAEAKISENRNNITVQFQHAYATLILYLDKLNQELKFHMDLVLFHVAAMSATNPYILSSYGEVFGTAPLNASEYEYGVYALVPESGNTHNVGIINSTEFPISYPNGTYHVAYRSLIPTDPLTDPGSLHSVSVNGNHDLAPSMVGQIAQQHNMASLDCITDWRRRCDDEAQEMVSRLKNTQGRTLLNDNKLDLVAKLSSLLIHLCNLSEQRPLNQSLACIDDLLKEIRQRIHPTNLKCFELSVEHFIGQILNALTSAANTRLHGYPILPNYPCM